MTKKPLFLAMEDAFNGAAARWSTPVNNIKGED